MKAIYTFIFCALTAILFGQSTTDHIHIDQFGYLPDGDKVAVISDPITGYNSAESYTPGTIFKVVNVNSGQTVYSANISQWKSGNTHDQSGDRGWWFDFSSLTTPGSYYILDESNNSRSYEFEIAEDVYYDVLKVATKMFYYNRCNMAKEEQYAGVKWKDGMNFMNNLQDANSRFYLDPNNAATERDLSGGWFDAGDYNKYVTFAHSAIHNLLYAYEESSAVFADDWDIPESGNGIPDILDEITYELTFLEKMMNSDGSVINKMGSVSYSDNGSSPPSANTDPRYYGPTCSSSSIALASMFGHAALVYQDVPSLASYANTLKNKAITCFNFVKPQLQSGQLDLNCDDGTIKAGDADWDAALQYENAVLAAIYLWELTGSNEYESYVKDNITDVGPISADWIGNTKNAVVEALLNYRTLPGADAAISDSIFQSFYPHMSQDWNGFFGMNDIDLYRGFVPTWAYYWGSSQSKADFANLNIIIDKYDFVSTTDDTYKKKVQEMIHYFHGVNPQNLVYLSNMYDFGAEKSVNEIYHTWFADGSIYDNALTSTSGPAPGYVTGGPNKDYTYNGLNPPFGQPAQKAYLEFNPSSVPENSWEITEPAIYYQAAFIRMLAYFTNKSSGCSGPSIMYVDETVSAGGNGSSWANAYLDLQNLLSNSCLAAIDTIKMAKGTYVLSGSDRSTSFEVGSGMVIEGGYNIGGLGHDPATYEVILSGNLGDVNSATDNAYHVVSIPSGSTEVVFKDISISDGYANGSGDDSLGAGIFCEGTLHLENVEIKNNFSANQSSIIYVSGNGHVSFSGTSKVIENQTN